MFAQKEMRVWCGILFMSFCLCLVPRGGLAGSYPVKIYIDADWSGAVVSSQSIERGLKTALEDVGGSLSGHPVELVRMNHRGNARRSLANLKSFLSDNTALAVFSGLHSPPLLANRDFINEHQILTFIPWAAAGPITRPGGTENWIFRLSVDDSKAGAFLVGHAVDVRKLKKPALLLEETGWGKSNQRTMLAALKEKGLEPAGVFWFNWGLNDVSARILLREIVESGADSVFFVGNAPEGKTFMKSALALGKEFSLPIISHWGITGGDFPEIITANKRKSLDLTFLQTKFSFVSQPDDPKGMRVMETAKRVFPNEIETPLDIAAPTGFIHAYDLGLLLDAAIKQAGGLSGDIAQDRKAIHDALEDLQSPVDGLIKTYSKPFSAYSQNSPDAHEALGADDFAIGRYGLENEVQLYPFTDEP